jgi:signal transduction histidine kinase
MTRRWQLWVVFALCLGVLLVGVGGISLAAIRLDRAEADARRQAGVEEDVRLALWRMDSAVAPLIARESARPYFVYAPLYAPERAYTRMLAEIGEGDVLVASPLLKDLPERVLLHFQVAPDGSVSSPQVPTGTARRLASRHTTGAEIAEAERLLRELRPLLDERELLAAVTPEPLVDPRDVLLPVAQAKKVERNPVSAEGRGSAASAAKAPAAPHARSSASKSSAEFLARSKQVVENVYSAPSQSAPAQGSSRASAAPREDATGQQRRPQPLPRRPAAVSEGAMTPAWLGDRLVLVRRVHVDRAEYLQGCVLDWTAIRSWLEHEAADLFPSARLEPARAEEASDRARLLAALPARLVPGARPAPAGDGSPLALILAVTWTMVLLASGAVLALLIGVQALSERRAAFVSAVTHELRTPLTTFRMYAEMLAEGMVRDEPQRRVYLETLRHESLRLGLLVENVLAYGRVERGKVVRRPEPLRLAELLERCGDRLRERARAAGMALHPDVPGELTVLGEPGALEQILFNLVDNACKYAAAGADTRIVLSASREGGRVLVRVRDFGPGIRRDDRGRLFVPFSRSAAHAAGAAPGVGLGLALCASLARSLRGSLALESVEGPGACFVLRLREASTKGRGRSSGR